MLAEPAPLIPRHMLEDPVPLVVALSIAGGLVLAIGWQRRQRRRSVVGLALLGLGALVWLVAALVDTDREKLVADTRRLLQATAPLDEPRLWDLLDPAAVVTGPAGECWYHADQILPELRGALRRFDVAGHRIDQIVAQTPRRGEGTTHFRLSTALAAEQHPVPIHSAWRLSWRRAADGRWLVTEIRWLEFERQKPMINMWR
jgi:hypothetical protein